MAAKKKQDEPYAKTNFVPEGGAEPVVQTEPEQSFEERTRVTRAWEVGDADPKDPNAEQVDLVGVKEMGDGSPDKTVATPVRKSTPESDGEGTSTPDTKTDGLKSGEDEPDGLEETSFEDLKKIATDEEVDTEGMKSKEDVREAIRAKRRDKTEE